MPQDCVSHGLIIVILLWRGRLRQPSAKRSPELRPSDSDKNCKLEVLGTAACSSSIFDSGCVLLRWIFPLIAPHCAGPDQVKTHKDGAPGAQGGEVCGLASPTGLRCCSTEYALGPFCNSFVRRHGKTFYGDLNADGTIDFSVVNKPFLSKSFPTPSNFSNFCCRSVE